jgi:deoxyribodipyrimidine photolyase-related protein
MPKTLRLILGDQLNGEHSWFAEVDDDITYCLFELRQETEYVRHHVQKILVFFAAMRRFAQTLREAGHKVEYLPLDAEDNAHSLTDNLARLLQQGAYQRFEYQYPDEYRLDRQLTEFCAGLEIEHVVCDSEHFLTERDAVRQMFEHKKTALMETFYRHMRKHHDVLMDGDQPCTGKWNHDQANRNKLPRGQALPNYPAYRHDVSELQQLLTVSGVDCFGEVDASALDWPLTAAEAEQELDDFLQHRLRHFGDYQDALSERGPWLFHSRLSVAMNLKLIAPQAVIDQAVAHWQANQDSIAFSQIEGFVRQILGWREFMRGIYWWQMPEYTTRNHFDQHQGLPSCYWDGDTELACLRHSTTQSLRYAYAHHIQRLMVLGNFALLTGTDPAQVDAWYLGVYADAIEWVQLPNTRGMSQYADGGLLATKPYVSGGAYINKMGDHCSGCRFDVQQKTGADACPFNYLYWHFIDQHMDKLQGNQRMAMMLSQWRKRKEADKQAVRASAGEFLQQLRRD